MGLLQPHERHSRRHDGSQIGFWANSSPGQNIPAQELKKKNRSQETAGGFFYGRPVNFH